MTLFVDDREPDELQVLLEGLVDSVKIGRYESGDYIAGDMAIERKDLQDFINSLNSGRYWNQIKVMRDTYKKPLVIHEWNPFGDMFVKRRISGRLLTLKLTESEEKAVREAQNATALGWGIPCIQTRDYIDTANRIAELYARLDKKSEPPGPAVIKASTPEEIKRNMLCVVRGVGPTSAKKILQRYSFQDLMSLSDPQDIKAVVKRLPLSVCKTILEVF